MKRKLLIYIGILVFALAACSKKDETPQPGTSSPGGGNNDGYNIVSIAPTSGKVGDKIVITTNQIEDVSQVTFNGTKASITTISNTQITVVIPEYATKGKILLEVRDKDLKAESTEDFNVEYPSGQLAFMGGDTRIGASGFTIGTKIYMGLDYGGDNIKDFWEYDTQNNTWTQKADFPGNKRGFAVGFTIDGKGYMGTGGYYDSGTSTYYKDFWQYDPATDKWTKKADFGGSARYGAVGFAINGKGYIGTGRDDKGHKNDMWEYRPDSDSWTQVGNLVDDNHFSLQRYQAVSFVIGNKAYVGAGYSKKKDFWEFDPAATDQWRKVADLGGAGRSGAIAFSIDGKGYVGTGHTGGFSKDFWQYDPTTDQWSRAADFNGSERQWAVGFAVGNKAYVGSGHAYKKLSDGYGYTKDFWQYTPQ